MLTLPPWSTAVLAPFLAGAPGKPSSSCPSDLDSSVSPTSVIGERSLLELDGLGVAAGLILFCFGGHATFPELHSSMTGDERPMFPAAVDCGCAIACAFYILFGER